MELFQPTHLLILGAIALLVFGGKKLPELGKGLGEGLRGFKDGVKGINEDPSASAKVGETAHIVTPVKTDDTPKTAA